MRERAQRGVPVDSRPPLQRGVEDSRWVQWRIITDFYKWLRARGVYLRVPDYYYLSGSNECGMGYREVNWSLPRAQQVLHTRQNTYDGTWQKTPSMGWMFVPLTQYHGGGAGATIEPLDKHRDHYERMLSFQFGRSDADDTPIWTRIREGAGPSLSLTLPLFVIGLVVAVVHAFHFNPNTKALVAIK